MASSDPAYLGPLSEAGGDGDGDGDEKETRTEAHPSPTPRQYLTSSTCACIGNAP